MSYARPIPRSVWVFPGLALIAFLTVLGLEAAPVEARPHALELRPSPELPSAELVLADPEHNPAAVVLGREDRQRLQARIDRINAISKADNERMLELMQAWARTRLENGMFEFVADEETVANRRGAGLIRTVTRDGLTRDVWIHPGECAELDLHVAEAAARFAGNRADLRDFITSCPNQGDRS